MSKLKWGLTLVVLVASSVWPGRAYAYPTFVAKGYSNCGTCHYSPTGGGMANAYGSATVEATFPNDIHSDTLSAVREVLMKSIVVGTGDDGESELHWDVGLDSRFQLLWVPREVNGDSTLVVIPMLIEAAGVVAYDAWMVYGSITPRRTGPERTPDSVFSREHWLANKISDATTVRAGRLVPPFGLRIPDHTQYSREELRLDKYAQSYGAQLDYATSSWLLSAALLAGDLTEPKKLREPGVVMSGNYNIENRGSIGVSVGVGQSRFSRRAAVGVHGRIRMLGKSYGLVELSTQHRAGRTNDNTENTLVGFGRIGWFVIDSLDLHVELGSRNDLAESDRTKLRYATGAAWQALPWIELLPTIVAEEDPEAGARMLGMVQLHVVY